LDYQAGVASQDADDDKRRPNDEADKFAHGFLAVMDQAMAALFLGTRTNPVSLVATRVAPSTTIG
jgi:hypothetical protein